MPSADDVVTHIVEALAAIEGEGVGMEGRHGYLVGVDMEFAGYVGEEMVLTYSLDPAPGGGAEVPESWAAEKLGYYFTPSTQMDTGFAEVWVPDLIAPGPFVVNAVVSLVSDGVPIARAQSEIIPE